MSDVLCDISAFRYYRTPPQVLALCPPAPKFETDRQRYSLKSHPLVKESIGVPIHLFAKSRQARTGAKGIRFHFLERELPFGSIRSTPLDIGVVSPLLTLFQMGMHIPETHLVMAMYEFCGWFSIFKPSQNLEDLLEQHFMALDARSFSWRRSADDKGHATDLWQRPPLVEIDELHAFADAMRNTRGGATFYRASQQVTGITASPFEVQTSMLLSLPRKNGGEGFANLQNNQPIKLSKAAFVLSGRKSCYADILFENNNKSLIIECQGASVHGNATSSILDSNRTTALQQMGYDVLLLSYAQIARQSNFDIVRKMIASKLNLKYRQKSDLSAKRERELRRDLFIDWNTLGSWSK